MQCWQLCVQWCDFCVVGCVGDECGCFVVCELVFECVDVEQCEEWYCDCVEFVCGEVCDGCFGFLCEKDVDLVVVLQVGMCEVVCELVRSIFQVVECEV